MKRLSITIALLVATACASVPLKQKATISLQSSQRVLASVQDTERQLCDPVKAAANSVITECVGATAEAVRLTSERHKAIATALVKAFDAQIKAATALQAWRSGDPAPAGLVEITKASNEALAVVRQLVPTNEKVKELLDKLQAVLDQVLEVNALLQGR